MGGVLHWAYLGHAVQSSVRDPWTSSKWIKASTAHNNNRSGPRSNKTTLAACKTMLSRLSGCALKKTASSGSSLLQPLTGVPEFFRCRAKALGAGSGPRVQWDGEGWYEILQQSFLPCGVWLPVRCLALGALGCWKVWCLLRIRGTPLAKSMGTWLLNWRSRYLNPTVRCCQKRSEILKTKNTLLPQWSKAFWPT